MNANLIAEDRDETRACLPAVVYQPIDRVILDPGNPRKHSKKQIGQIARSLKEFGFNVPILVDADLRVVAGHGRLLAARQLGLQRVPTIALEHLNPEQAKAFAIADNRLGELSTWDDRLLGERLSELSKLELDFSLDVTGFEIPKIELLIEGAPPQRDPADRMPRAQPGPAVCRPGDLWELGRHLIYCGNALDEPSYKVLMGEDRAAMVFTEPLRDTRSAGHVYELSPVRGERLRFLIQVCALLSLYSRPGSIHYLCADWRDTDQLLNAARQVRFEQVDLCVWAKDKPGSGSLYQSQHELVLVFEQCRLHEPDPSRRNKSGRPRSNLWRYPEPCSSRGDCDRAKPVRLVADAIVDSTAPREIVLDAFLGQGTTLIAADRVERACRGLEVDPRAIDSTIRRWQALTGKTARHSATGRTFDDISSTFGDRT
jgi:DNA modification methylase